MLLTEGRLKQFLDDTKNFTLADFERAKILYKNWKTNEELRKYVDDRIHVFKNIKSGS